jgi:hypothetical protein
MNEYVAAFIFLAFIALIVFVPIQLYFASVDEITMNVTEKERIAYEQGSRYLVWTENEVFENTDAWIFLKFDSSDIYGKIKVGHTYKTKVVGWRIPFFSWYRDIINVEELVE